MSTNERAAARAWRSTQQRGETRRERRWSPQREAARKRGEWRSAPATDAQGSSSPSRAISDAQTERECARQQRGAGSCQQLDRALLVQIEQRHEEYGAEQYQNEQTEDRTLSRTLDPAAQPNHNNRSLPQPHLRQFGRRRGAIRGHRDAGGSLEEWHRIYGNAADTHFEVDVVARAAARTAHARNGLPARDAIAFGN